MSDLSQSHHQAVKCDLVLLSWNRADLLVPCVERLLKYTRIPCRLIIMDNASTDSDAVTYLAHVKGTAWVDVVVVKRAHNDGFAIGMNDGLSRTSAPWICLLNDDILVTEGWLAEMIDVAESNSQVGLLNPLSNEFNVDPRPGETVDEVAQRLRSRHGRWLENSVGVGFCLLFSRRVFERVGYLDDQFEFMYCEDTDYSFRVHQTGWMCAIAEGAYVYHHQRSGIKQDPTLLTLMLKNRERLAHKWRHEAPCRIAYLLDRADGASTMAQAQHIRSLANQGHRVWVFYTSDTQASVPRHFQVIPERFPRFLYRTLALWRLLFKKKRFQRIIVSNPWDQRVMQALKSLHRADIICHDGQAISSWCVPPDS